MILLLRAGFTPVSDMLKPFQPLVWVVLGLAILAVLLQVVLGYRAGRIEFPYGRKEALFTPAERSFLGVLEQVTGADYRIFGMVRLADLLKVTGVGNRSRRQSAFNRISGKHLDFVVCEAASLEILFAIELDDSSHARRDRQKRDRFVDRACAAAGLPLARIPAKRSYSRKDIEDAVTSVAPAMREQAIWK